ncbi:MAG: hypothetical protein JWO73_732 [Candidatus Taylorbacteria bacterium]|nr:hypothetical protein [Candidatus Taylorbacteria bacterium]
MKTNHPRKFTEAFWRRLTNFWTIIFFIVVIADYVMNNALDHDNVILIVSVLYGASLAIYSAEKEFKRWHDCHETMHPGELYVICWTLLVFGILAANVFIQKNYELPAEVRATYVVVVGVLALTKESKHLYRRQKKCEVK